MSPSISKPVIAADVAHVLEELAETDPLGPALEPVIVTAETGPSPEWRDMTRRFWLAVALSVPAVILGMGRDLIGPAAGLVGVAHRPIPEMDARRL